MFLELDGYFWVMCHPTTRGKIFMYDCCAGCCLCYRLDRNDIDCRGNGVFVGAAADTLWWRYCIYIEKHHFGARSTAPKNCARKQPVSLWLRQSIYHVMIYFSYEKIIKKTIYWYRYTFRWARHFLQIVMLQCIRICCVTRGDRNIEIRTPLNQFFIARNCDD